MTKITKKGKKNVKEERSGFEGILHYIFDINCL